jgi:adenosylcobinamide-GDP ribazoletransferase
VSRQLALFFTAAQFLTRLPTPALRDFDPSSLSRSLRYFPLVGVLVGLINVAVWWLASLRLPASVSIGLMLAASAVLTGALHEDGFADACDGFGAGNTPGRVLAIMKDSRIGAYGAIGISLMLGLKWTVLAALPLALFPLIVIAAHSMSRWCAIGLIWRLAYVRTDSEGKAKSFAGRLSGFGWTLSGLIGIAGFAPLAFAWLRWSGAGAAPGAIALSAAVLLGGAVAAAFVALFAAVYFRRRLGGYTGDCLGAAQQLAELAFLLGGLAAIPRR